jgi:hypothetical protein
VKIQHVPLDWVVATWPRVEGFIASALGFSDDYTIEEWEAIRRAPAEAVIAWWKSTYK